MSNQGSVRMLNEVASAQYSDRQPNRGSNQTRTFQATGQTTVGGGSATVKIWGSNVDAPAEGTDTEWVLLGTISLTLTTTKSTDGFAVAAAWRWLKAELDAVAGTGAAVSVWMGA